MALAFSLPEGAHTHPLFYSISQYRATTMMVRVYPGNHCPPHSPVPTATAGCLFLPSQKSSCASKQAPDT